MNTKYKHLQYYIIYYSIIIQYVIHHFVFYSPWILKKSLGEWDADT